MLYSLEVRYDVSETKFPEYKLFELHFRILEAEFKEFPFPIRIYIYIKFININQVKKLLNYIKVFKF